MHQQRRHDSPPSVITVLLAHQQYKFNGNTEQNEHTSPSTHLQ